MSEFQNINPKTVFAVACHPDDIEFVMGGTLLLLKDRGCKLHYMTLTNGSWGTSTLSREEIIRARRQESKNAADFLGAVYHDSLTDDLDVFYERSLCMKLCSVIREVDPDILLLQSPVDYMEDHQNAVRLAVTAAFCKGMPLAPVDPPQKATLKSLTVYHAQPHGNLDPMRKIVHAERYVDISSVLERKRQMLGCHLSQKEWLDVSQGFDSYLDTMTQLSKETGGLSGHYIFAEGWRRRNALGFGMPDDDPLGEILSDVSMIDPDYSVKN